jgi:hypothetical protein
LGRSFRRVFVRGRIRAASDTRAPEKFAVKRADRAGLLLLLSAVCAATVFGCLLCYRYDNKYTSFRPEFVNGSVEIGARTLAEHPVIFLTDGWAYYGGRLLSPRDFDGTHPLAPDAYIYIGQYGGFEAGTADGAPHGSATYRLLIDLPNEQNTYMLELPEIFSAYRAYVNGDLLVQTGEPDPTRYRPETLNTAAVFSAAGRLEIVIAVSDFSHLYSGMVYPPAFGLPQAVSRLLFSRFLFRASFCAAALIIGLLSVLAGVMSRRVRSALVYGLLCLSFVGYIAYPLVKTFVRGYYPFYAFENLSFCVMLVAAVLLLHDACGIKGRRALVFPQIGVLVCVASVILHLLLARKPENLLAVLYAYSHLITAYEWITAAYLTWLSLRAVRQGAIRIRPILVGITVFDTALIMDRALSLHEPIFTGWFPETASFALALCIGWTVGVSAAAQYRESAVLRERANGAERLIEMQRSYYAVLDEKMEDTRALRHDLRHHIAALTEFVSNEQYAELKSYLSDFRRDAETAAPKEYSKNRVVNALANHFDRVAFRSGIRFALRCELAEEVPVADVDLSALLGNLLENATEACVRATSGERFIRVGIAHLGNMLHIRVTNSAAAGPASFADANRFASSKAEGRSGYGLYSIRMIAKKYNGQSETAWDEDSKVFTHTVSLFTETSE